MTAAQRKYVLIESLIGATIGAIFSLAFTLTLFGGHTAVPLWGVKGIIIDAIPHTFMIALPSMLVPTLLTRRRIKHGAVEQLLSNHKTRLSNVMPRSVAVAIVATALGTGLYALILPNLTPATWSSAWVIAFKTAYGALVGLVISRLAVRTALRDGNMI
jgi:hypothetical protein